MNVTNAIKERRSIKFFDPSHKIPAEEVKELLELTALTPTAFNLQHFRFIVAENPELRQQLKEVSWNQPQVSDSSLLVIVCADLNAWKTPERCWYHVDDKIKNSMSDMIKKFYKNNDQLQRDEAFRSAGMASMTLMLAAKSMGYDSCPMDGFDFDKVAKIINLPEDHMICMFVAIGKQATAPFPKGGLLKYQDLVQTDSF